jgi:hypothetical protein
MPTGNRVNNTPTIFAGIEVEESSTELAKANENRNGLQVVNASTAIVYVALGKTAEQKKGIYLAASGGAWDGMIGASLWTGAVNAIAPAAKSFVTVTEV